ncbi:MAG: hypothetical protein FMNOHCHN_00013 [Ignavibacteriaceae bacterium]|nr:hypothetical protein [Ignavibacteriaceae bacterium]
MDRNNNEQCTFRIFLTLNFYLLTLKLARGFYGCSAALILADRNTLRSSAKSAGKFFVFAPGSVLHQNGDFTDAPRHGLNSDKKLVE